MLNLANTTVKVRKLMVMKALEGAPDASPAEVHEYLSLNGIEGVPYDKTYKLVANLEYDGLADCDNGLYKLNDAGRKEIEKIQEELRLALEIADNFKTAKTKASSEEPEKIMPEMYNTCPEVKIIPFSTRNTGYDVDDYLGKILPNEKNHEFYFGTRGLGENVRKGTLVAFKHKNLIKYVAVLDSYNRADEVKSMTLIPGSIHKLSMPVTMKDMEVVREDFRFTMNKQTLEHNERESFVELIRNKW